MCLVQGVLLRPAPAGRILNSPVARQVGSATPAPRPICEGEQQQSGHAQNGRAGTSWPPCAHIVSSLGAAVLRFVPMGR